MNRGGSSFEYPPDLLNNKKSERIGFEQETIELIDEKEVTAYYEDLLQAFQNEFRRKSPRRIIESISGKASYTSAQQRFLRNIVVNGFNHAGNYQYPAGKEHDYQHPIQLLQYIVDEGYTPTSPFVIWAHSKLGVPWNAMDWFTKMERHMAGRDIKETERELKTCPPNKLPQVLEMYYRAGSGIERMTVDPTLGIRHSFNAELQGNETYKGFDPMEYLDYYYGGLDQEDMTIARTFYNTLIANRKKLPIDSTALIVGNGPVPDEAQALAMIPEIATIVPADVDERNVKIMRMHTGAKNPLATQKARPGEEHADFIHHLFEQHAGMRSDLFAVREITAVKTVDPIYVDITQQEPLNRSENPDAYKHLSADLVVVPFCPESITSSAENYERYLENTTSLVAPGKHLCMLALKDARYYTAGKKRLEAFPIDEVIVTEKLTRLGFVNIHITTINTGLDAHQRGFADSMVIWADKT